MEGLRNFTKSAFPSRNEPATQATLVKRGVFNSLIIIMFLIGLTFLHGQVHQFESPLVHWLTNGTFVASWIFAFFYLFLISRDLERMEPMKSD